MAQLREDARRLLSQSYLAGLSLPEVEQLLRAAHRELANGPGARAKE